MATAVDVATYILQKLGPTSAMKLQKLVYYSQAWSLVWDDRPLFGDRIEAWANGPVIPNLYSLHPGQFTVDPKAFDIYARVENLDATARETIDAVLDGYGKKGSFFLSELTHSENPWIDARAGLQPGERGSKEITPAAMAEFYGGLVGVGAPVADGEQVQAAGHPQNANAQEGPRPPGTA